MNKKLTLKEFRNLTENLPEDLVLTYHNWDEGNGLNAYRISDLWFYPKDSNNKTHLVLNPGNDWDSRGCRKVIDT